MAPKFSSFKWLELSRGLFDFAQIFAQFYRVTPGVLQTFTVRGQRSRSQRDVSAVNGLHKLTEFKLGENYARGKRNMFII